MAGWQLLVLGYFLGAPLGFLLCSVLVASKDPPKPHTTCKDCILTNKTTSTARRLRTLDWPQSGNRKSCKGCIYNRPLTFEGSGQQRYCLYCYDTGKPRGCPPEKCDKKTVRRLKN